MIEVFPVMLLILGWQPDKPGEIDLQRPEVIFFSMEDCERDGALMAERMTKAAADKSGAIYQHRCFEFPSDEEFEAAAKRKSQASE